jgi:hypothetical protein
MILFLKSLDGSGTKRSLQEKLVLIFKQRVEDAEDDEERARAERDLKKLTRHSPAISRAQCFSRLRAPPRLAMPSASTPGLVMRLTYPASASGAPSCASSDLCTSVQRSGSMPS